MDFRQFSFGCNLTISVSPIADIQNMFQSNTKKVGITSLNLTIKLTMRNFMIWQLILKKISTDMMILNTKMSRKCFQLNSEKNSWLTDSANICLFSLNLNKCYEKQLKDQLLGKNNTIESKTNRSFPFLWYKMSTFWASMGPIELLPRPRLV